MGRLFKQKKEQQVKTVELRVETEVPGLTKYQLQDAIDKEVRYRCYLFCADGAVFVKFSL